MRDIRADDEQDEDEVYTFGGGQLTPKNFMALLKSSKYKKEFLRFFYTEIRNQEYANIIGKKVLYCSVDNECICLYCDEQGLLEFTEVQELFGAHEEADTRVAFHTLHVDKYDPGNTIVRCNDTDIKIIMVTNADKYDNSDVWLDVGLDHNNSRHYINIKATAEKLKCKHPKFVKALPGAYGFSGLDFIPAFMRKGKKRPVKLMLKDERFIDVFSRLGEEELTDLDIAVMEAFTCAVFGYPKLSQINEARFAFCNEKCAPETSSSPLDRLKSVDPNLFPPCQSVLLQQIKRTWFLAHLYKHATESDPLGSIIPLDYGYELIDGRMGIKWYEGDQVPQEMDESDDEDEEAENETDDELVENDETDDDSDIDEDD